MSKRNDGGAAFPRIPMVSPTGGSILSTEGMYLRDWFAGQALAGWLSMQLDKDIDLPKPGLCENVASYAYSLADAMIAARAK